MKKSLLRFITVLLSVVLLSCAAAACSVNDGDTGNEIDEKVKEIDFTADENFSGSFTLITSSADAEIRMMNEVIKKFNEKYPYIRVNYKQEIEDQYYPSLTTAAGTAETLKDYSLMPDIFWYAQDRVDSFYGQGFVMPLSAIAAKDENFSFDEIVEEALDTCKVGDEVYLMPRDYNQVVMYFNQDIFDAAGVAYPTAKMSGEEFMKMLDDLRAGIDKSDATNDYGSKYKDVCQYLIDVNAMWDSFLWPLIKGFGGRVINEAGEVVLDSENTYNAINFWKTLRTKGYVGTCTTSNMSVNFRMQQAPIFFHVRAMLTALVEGNNRVKGVKNLGVTALPQFGTEYAIGSGSSGYGMYVNSMNKTASWLFLKFLVSEEGQNALCLTGNGIPSVKKMLNDDNATWRKWTHASLGTAFDQNAFIYGLNDGTKAASSTRDFFKYLPISIQSDVLNCLGACFNIIDSGDNGEEAIRYQLSNQADLIEYYINRANR